jgi:hypothetical protein
MTCRRVSVWGVAAVLIVASCSGGGGDSPEAGPTRTTAPPTTPDAQPEITDTVPPVTAPPTPADEPTLQAIADAIASAPAGCDPLDTRQCVLPFPSDALADVDGSAVTGMRVQIPADGLPANAEGVHVDPAEWNRNDGFSANSTILTHVADLDAEASKLPAWTDLEASLAPDATVVLVDTSTGERVPLWAEPDVKAEDPADRLLVIHPAISLAPATTYAVGLRGLVGTGGEPVEVSPVFAVFRDDLSTDVPEIEDRRAAMENALRSLTAAGVERNDLQLAWSFTTASTENITERVLHMRDETLAGLGAFTPEFAITQVTDTPEGGLARLVEGTFSVPNWLEGDGSPGNGIRYGPDGRPASDGVVQAPFACEIARNVWEGTEPARMVVYGHGLLGSHREVTAGNIIDMSNEHNAVYCATKWAGFSDEDIPNAIASLQDLSNFPTFVDRMQQGFVNQMVLGRMMLADNGLVGEPEFLRPDGTAVLDTSALQYDGNSQGGIMGLALAGLSTDFERAVLGVVGMNYSILLPRSVDFDTYEAVFIPSYPSALDRALLISVVQMLWDRGEGAGFVRHVVADPLPGTPEKDLLLHVALGDWQVSELTAMIAARTMGIPIHRPVTGEGRSREADPGWGIDTLDYGTARSGLVVWDSGSDPIPVDGVAPRTSRDPHSDPRRDADVRRQKAAFLFDGELIDVCAAQACTADVS